jgi:hypothetical protein
MANKPTVKIRAILTGATGMVGEGVLHECLRHKNVERVLVVGRRPCGVSHPKMKEIIHENFHDISPIKEGLVGYDACFFCLGVSSIGMKEEEYRHVTYDLTMHMAKVLSVRNPDMTFCYVSGAGTDGTEQGKVAWARIKGKLENDLMKLPFKRVYAFRPGFMKPTPGLKNAHQYYKYFNPLYPLARVIFPNWVSTLSELGLAMINAAILGYDKQVLYVKDIVELAKR